MPHCEGCDLSRRDFVSAPLLAAAALLLSACGGDSSTEPPEPLPTGTQVNLSSYPELSTVGGVALVTVFAYRLAIIRTGQTSYLALSRVCPHQGGTINREGEGFKCARHGATFDKNGTWTGGQRTNNMTRLNTTYDPATNTLTIL